MLFKNRHGLLFSRPWRPLSRRPHAKLVTLLQAYPRCVSALAAQEQAYWASIAGRRDASRLVAP